MSCLCGCGAEVVNKFKPGHDQRFRSSLERRAGGIEAMRDLVDAAEQYASGKSDSNALADKVAAIMGKSGRVPKP